MITMWYDFLDEIPYPYKKGVVFYLAYLMKIFKRLKIGELEIKIEIKEKNNENIR